MHPARRLVLASDRGPVQFSASPAHGLISVSRNGSVTSLLEHGARFAGTSVAWVAPSTEPLDGHAAALGKTELASGIRFEPVVVSAIDYARYYDDVGVEVIWTAWHEIGSDVPVRTDPDGAGELMSGYRRVNQAVADRIVQVAAPGGLVSVHDYQLMLVPAMVRRRRPDLRIGYFSHIPFPSGKALSAVPGPVVRALVAGMLGASLLGFHRVLWARRFLATCEQLGLPVHHDRGCVRTQGQCPWVRCFPGVIDAPTLIGQARSPGVRRWARCVRQADRRMIIARVDRLDPAKNALGGFAAYGEFLRRHPGWADQVRFVACLIPSRQRLPAYRGYAARTWQLVAGINARHPGAITVHLGHDRDRALGVLSVHDVLLVNPVTDGMNLVAQEAALINGNDGAIVLSTGAGAADLLPGAIPLHDPLSPAETADAIEVALSLSRPERRARAGRMRDALLRAASNGWLAHQLADLDAVTSGGQPCCPLHGTADVAR